MTRTLATLALAAFATGSLAAREDSKTPTIDQALELKRVGSPVISPDGRQVAYTVRETNWDENAFETEIWIVNAVRLQPDTTADDSQPRQLTRAKKSSSAPAWSPDGRRLAFISDRSDKRQIYLINIEGGEAEPITTDAKESAPEGVNSFAWSRDGKAIAFTAQDPKPEALKERDKKYGEFSVVDQDHRMTHLHVVDPVSKTVRRLTDGAFTVGSFDWSPDGSDIAFDHRTNDDPANGGTADISIVRIADGSVRKLVTQEGPDASPKWSPDGTRVVFDTAMANPWFYYGNGVLATIPAGGGTIDVLSKAFDEDPQLLAWGPDGIYFGASDKTYAHLYRIDPSTKTVTKLTRDARGMPFAFSFTKDFRSAAFVESGADRFAEIAVADLATMTPRRLTDLGTQLKDWALGPSEVISWKSTDGATIEGVLHKPPDFAAGRRYPLIVVIHGGPTGISRPAKFRTNGVYPIDIWLSKGALVLEPNYRGSAGYGEQFRSLNVRNLGVGDAWDVVSGVDALVAQGLVDRDRVGAAGWSQGGYISAFLTTHDSARFKAISVGAGISDWMTYYVNTDIHPFTRQYLKATPWDDPQIYAKTSPITYIKGARTPTLIQHGELDQRVPIPNAYELYQGIQDQGVPVKLIVYKGFGHGLNKPKAQRAALEHNLDWFDRYLFGQSRTTNP